MGPLAPRYMLVLHQYHNLFGDPLVIPLFMLVTFGLKIFAKFVMKLADRFKVRAHSCPISHSSDAHDEARRPPA